MLVIQVRIPKTATTSIEKALKVLRHNHKISMRSFGHTKTSGILSNYTQEQIENAVVLASIRNPYDKLVSAYRFIMQYKKDKRETNLKYVFDYPSFKDFCMGLKHDFERNQFFHPQVRWLYDGDKQFYDFLIRYESLNKDWKRFLKTYNLPNVELSQIRKTNRDKWHKYYDKESKEAIYKLYEEDFRRLEYVH
jgi:hypothetical protein